MIIFWWYQATFKSKEDCLILHPGGNLKAPSIATSIVKMRLAISAIGKIMFEQGKISERVTGKR
ncbi:phenylalanine ammonia-lyase [Puccinia sorghi]|uniref:Phenylalanine ammonia-lyase n=1 Tax=Puccinia sorghi TaxID=27349 RepID=A0A0L6USH7_9BASI|nr:phenylalanine ammonia-lyase [Puccinia sorghi]